MPTRTCRSCGVSRDAYRWVYNHDPCISRLPRTNDACCGHGFINEAYVVLNDTQETLRGQKALDYFKALSKGPPTIIGEDCPLEEMWD